MVTLAASEGCNTPARPTSTSPPAAGSDSPSGQEQLDIADGEPRRILARLVDPANPREWVLNVLGISAEERETYHFLWDLGDDTHLTGAMVRHTFAQVGLYNVTLQATDPANRPAYVLSQVVAVGVDGSSADFLVSFEARVDYGAAPPTIWAKAATTALETGETVAFAWSMSDGATAAGPELNHVLSGTDPFRVSVTATTSLGRTGSYFRYFSPTGDDVYDPAETELVADAGTDQTVAPGETVTLDGSGSTYSGQAPVTFLWTQIAGPAVTLERNDRPLVRFTAPEADSGPVTLEFRLTLTSGDQSASDTATITVTPTMALAGTPFYGMEVVSVVPEADGVTVTTSGGIYEVKPGGIDAWRRIAPATNSVNPRKVATLTFAPSVGVFSVESADRRSCVLKSAGGLRVQINSDSLVFLENTGASQTYTYTSLLPNPPWAKGKDGDFYYNDGDGGTCHYMHPDTPGTYGGGTGVPNTFAITLATGKNSAFGVFPPREFDFEKLYGQNSRPHCLFVNTDDECRVLLGQMPGPVLDDFTSRGFGVLILHGALYTEGPNPTLDPSDGLYKYEYRDPALVGQVIGAATDQGYKVLGYCNAPRVRWRKQPLEVNLAWMHTFQQELQLQGWYFDNAGIDLRWTECYEFVRRVREDVGSDGVLYHHCTRDPWGQDEGWALQHLNAYVDYTMKGEFGSIAMIDSLDSLYLNYFAAAYGTCQAITLHKLSPESTVTYRELAPYIATTLYGTHRRQPSLGSLSRWDREYKPHYDRMKERYVTFGLP